MRIGYERDFCNPQHQSHIQLSEVFGPELFTLSELLKTYCTKSHIKCQNADFLTMTMLIYLAGIMFNNFPILAF